MTPLSLPSRPKVQVLFSFAHQCYFCNPFPCLCWFSGRPWGLVSSWRLFRFSFYSKRIFFYSTVRYYGTAIATKYVTLQYVFLFIISGGTSIPYTIYVSSLLFRDCFPSVKDIRVSTKILFRKRRSLFYVSRIGYCVSIW